MSMVTVETSSLSGLAEKANGEHRAAEAAAQSWLSHAIAAGDALLEAKRHIPRGEWMQWLEESVDFAPSTALLYARVATYREEASKVESPDRPTVTRALRGLPPVSGERAEPKAMDEAKALVESGFTQTEAAEALGVTQTTISRWVDPRKMERNRRRARERAREQARAKRALEDKRRREARDAAAKRAGGAVSHAYSGLRKTLNHLQAAIEESDDREVEAALRSAMEYLHKANDEIIRAIGVNDGA